MINQRKGSMDYTQTSAGQIPHLHKDGIDMPVALVLDKTWSPKWMCIPAEPERTPDGDLIYVAPGGRRVLA